MGFDSVRTGASPGAQPAGRPGRLSAVFVEVKRDQEKREKMFASIFEV